jgi:tetrahydromethanopterin S-methyltransferase subunit A
MAVAAERPASALHVINHQIEEALFAPKCHMCGCLRQTVEALAETEPGRRELAPILAAARIVIQPKRYDCLGCPICYPALAVDAFVEAWPEAAAGLHIPVCNHGLTRPLAPS